jgi:hypothetical protein
MKKMIMRMMMKKMIMRMMMKKMIMRMMIKKMMMKINRIVIVIINALHKLKLKKNYNNLIKLNRYNYNKI